MRTEREDPLITQKQWNAKLRELRVANEQLAAVLAKGGAREAVAWRCKDYADGWIIYSDIHAAQKYHQETGCLFEPLYAATIAPPPAVPADGATTQRGYCSGETYHAGESQPIEDAAPSSRVSVPESIERRKSEWAALDAAIQTYSNGYEYGDTGYTPSDQQMAICHDFLQGLIADESFINAIAQTYPVRSKFAPPAPDEDGERYRYWRKHYSAEFVLQLPGATLKFAAARPIVEMAGENYEQKVDAAIDAARKARAGKEPTK